MLNVEGNFPLTHNMHGSNALRGLHGYCEMKINNIKAISLETRDHKICWDITGEELASFLEIA